jgi:hypothetical protein
MTASENHELQDSQATWPRPIMSQSSRHANYFPEKRTRQRVRRPNAFVAARMGYWAVS